MERCECQTCKKNKKGYMKPSDCLEAILHDFEHDKKMEKNVASMSIQGIITRFKGGFNEQTRIRKIIKAGANQGLYGYQAGQ